jgi:nucleotide-binding universal stress UspA family protein
MTSADDQFSGLTERVPSASPAGNSEAAAAEAGPRGHGRMEAAPMGRIRHILCCTDLSAASEPAWREACVLARVLGADVLLLHVVTMLIVPPELFIPPAAVQEWTDAGDQEALEGLARLRDQQTLPTTRVMTRVEIGSASDGILRVADSARADLVVMGTHGRTGLSLTLLGSVADRVVRLAPCAVVTVGARPDRPVQIPERLGRICYATDFSAPAHAVWPLVLTLAEATGAEVDLVHVIQDVAAGRDRSSPSSEHIARALRGHGESQAHRLIQGSPLPEGRIQVVMPTGVPAEEIMRSAEARHADMIVMATHGWSGLRRWMLGSVAQHVIQAAPCPVLTVGPHTPHDEPVSAA